MPGDEQGSVQRDNEKTWSLVLGQLKEGVHHLRLNVNPPGMNPETQRGHSVYVGVSKEHKQRLELVSHIVDSKHAK